MDERFPTFEAIPYIRHDRLLFCFGHVIEGLDELESLMKNENRSYVVSDCGVLVE